MSSGARLRSVGGLRAFRRTGGQIALALVLDIRKPYHINSNKAKEGFVATTVELTKAPPEVISTTPLFPRAQEIEFGAPPDKDKIQVFSDHAVVYVPLSVSSGAKPGERELSVKIRYQACASGRSLRSGRPRPGWNRLIWRVAYKRHVVPALAKIGDRIERSRDDQQCLAPCLGRVGDARACSDETSRDRGSANHHSLRRIRQDGRDETGLGFRSVH